MIFSSSGSTAGGIKIVRFLVALRAIQLLIGRSAMPPNAVAAARIGQKRIGIDETVAALATGAAFAMLVLLCWLPFLAAGLPPLETLFDVVSAAATTGLSTGITSPDLPDHLKIVLCVAMLAGRVEVLALLVLLRPRTWLSRHGDF